MSLLYYISKSSIYNYTVTHPYNITALTTIAHVRKHVIKLTDYGLPSFHQASNRSLSESLSDISEDSCKRRISVVKVYQPPEVRGMPNIQSSPTTDVYRWTWLRLPFAFYGIDVVRSLSVSLVTLFLRFYRSLACIILIICFGFSLVTFAYTVVFSRGIVVLVK